MGTAIVLALILGALVAVIASAANSLAHTPSPAAAKQDGAGVRVRLMCPRTGEHAAVRIGQDPLDRALAVVWCQHFPAGPIDCGRECFTSLEADATVLLEPA